MKHTAKPTMESKLSYTEGNVDRGGVRSGKEQTMTNKEAIEALKRIRDEATNEFIGDWADYEAFDIAIKALKGADDD